MVLKKGKVAVSSNYGNKSMGLKNMFAGYQLEIKLCKTYCYVIKVRSLIILDEFK